MKNKLIRLLIILFIIIFILSLNVNADVIDVDDWTPSSTGSNAKLSEIAGKVLGVLQVAGTIISVIVIIFIGIKYMCGSIEERVEYRKTMLPYLIGSIMVFATTSIASFLYIIGKSI